MTDHGYARLGFRHGDDAGKVVTTRRTLLVIGIVALIAGVWSLFVPAWEFRGEGGPLELMQVTLLLLGAVIAFATFWPRPTARDRWNVFWLSVLLSGMVWRELDGHIWFNSPRLGIWAIHYRMDWLTSMAVPWYVKAAWALLAIAGVAAVMVPLYMARPDGLAQLRRRDLGAWLFVFGVAAIVAGYMSDDLFGRNQFVDESITQLIEESFELLAALPFLLLVIVSVESRVDAREGKTHLMSAPHSGQIGDLRFLSE